MVNLFLPKYAPFPPISRRLEAIDVIDVLFILRGVPGHIRSDDVLIGNRERILGKQVSLHRAVPVASFGSFLSQPLGSVSRVRASAHSGDEPDFETGSDQPVRENVVIVPRWFDPDDDGSRRRVQRRDKTIVIGSSVEDGHSASTSLARVDQNLVAVFYGTELISVAILCWSQEAAV